MDLHLTCDEAVSLRQFLIAIIFKNISVGEVEMLICYSIEEIFETSCAIYVSPIVKKDEKIIFKLKDKDLDIINQCIFNCVGGLPIYSYFKKDIDYGTCDFSNLAKELSSKLFPYLASIGVNQTINSRNL
jgi:hypothetical protein